LHVFKTEKEKVYELNSRREFPHKMKAKTMAPVTEYKIWFNSNIS